MLVRYPREGHGCEPKHRVDALERTLRGLIDSEVTQTVSLRLAKASAASRKLTVCVSSRQTEVCRTPRCDL